ncbi:MAG TPA: hypothetical protein VFZ85_07575 [Jiangellaceae bacterium]
MGGEGDSGDVRRPGRAAVIGVLVTVGALDALTIWGQHATRPANGRLGLDIAVAITGWLLSPALL